MMILTNFALPDEEISAELRRVSGSGDDAAPQAIGSNKPSATCHEGTGSSNTLKVKSKVKHTPPRHAAVDRQKWVCLLQRPDVQAQLANPFHLIQHEQR